MSVMVDTPLRECFLDGRAVLWPGDCRQVLPGLAENSFDSCVTDPPYGLGFMGKGWDHGVPDVGHWRAIFRTLKPGAHLVAFGGTRTFGRLWIVIEEAGFEIRDTIMWLYGSGFPKSLDVSKAIDKAAGALREIVAQGDPVKRMIPGANQHKGGWEKNSGRVFVPNETAPTTEAAQIWDGWGTALKPAVEPIILARKPLSESTVAANVLKWGTGALNIDGCRVGVEPRDDYGRSAANRRGTINAHNGFEGKSFKIAERNGDYSSPQGRWPANLIHDGSEEVIAAFPDVHGAGAERQKNVASKYEATSYHAPEERQMNRFGDSGSAARFFYTAKADADDRLGSKHPTVKPLDLMQYLVRLVTPKGGTVLDPFAGTGTTAEAALREGMSAVLIEREEEYCADIRRRMALVMSGAHERKRESIKARNKIVDDGPLFGALL